MNFSAKFFDRGLERPALMAKALASLEAAAPFFPEFGYGRFAIHHLTLNAQAVSLKDPGKGLDLLIDALALAVNLWDKFEARGLASSIKCYAKELDRYHVLARVRAEKLSDRARTAVLDMYLALDPFWRQDAV